MLGWQPPPYPGQTGAPPTEQERAAQQTTVNQLLEAYMTGLYPASLTQLAATATGQYLPMSSPYIAQIMAGMGALAEQQRQRALQDLRARYARFGQEASSPLAQAEAALTGSVIGQLTQQLGTLGLQSLEAERQRMMEASGLGTAIEPGLARQLYEMGTTQRQFLDAAIQRAMQEYARAQEMFWRPFSAIGPGVGAIPIGVPQYAPSPAAGIIGGLGALMGTSLQGTLLGRLLSK
jgi:hypothetical protein